MIPRPKLRKYSSVGRYHRTEDYGKPDTPVIENSIYGDFKGINVEKISTQIDDREFTNLKNVHTKDGVIQKAPGYYPFKSGFPLDGKVWGIFERENVVPTKELFAVTSKSLYVYNSITGVWEFFSAASENIFTGGDNDIVEYDMIYSENDGDMISIFTNCKDNIKYQVGASDPANLITAWKARYTKSYSNCQFYAYINETNINYPQQVRWSDIGKPGTITGGLSGGIFLGKTADVITALATVRGYIIVLKEKTLSVGSFTGSYTFPFQWEENSLDRGTLAGRTVVNIGDELLFLGDDLNVYLTDGTMFKNVSRTVRKLLGERINQAKVHRSFSKFIMDKEWYLLSIPTGGSDWPNETWVLNIKDWTWQPLFYDDMMSMGYSRGIHTGTKIKDLTMTIGQINWKIGDTLGQPGSVGILIGDIDGYIYEVSDTKLNKNTSILECIIDTKNFEYEKDLMKRLVEFEIEARGIGSLEIWYSINNGSSWIKHGSIILTSDWKIHNYKLSVNFHRIMIRIRNNSLNEFFFVRGFSIKRINKGHVKDSV